MKSFLKYILASGIVFLPLFYWEVPKVWAYLIFINLFSLFILYLSFNENLYLSLKKSKLKSVLFLFLIVSTAFSLLGVNLTKSLVGNYYRFDGLIVLFQLTGFSIVFSSVYQVGWNKLIAASIFTSAVVSSLWNNFGQLNFLVGFVLTALPFGFYLIKTEENKYLKFAVLIGFLSLLRVPYVADSYIGLLGFMISIPLWLILQNKRNLRMKLLIIPIICAIFVFLFIWFKDINKHKEYVAENRIRIYRNVFMGSLKRPILGYGWANTDYAFNSVVWPLKFNDDVYVDKAHMLFLDIFANVGIVGLGLYLMFLFLLFKKLYKQNNIWANALIVSILMHLLYANTNVTSISEEFVFWLIVGIIMSI